MTKNSLAAQAPPFLNYLDDWLASLTALPIQEGIPDPAKAAIISVDITNGFCYEGPLSSPRVAGIVEPTRQLFERTWQHGVRNIVLTQDTHEPEAVEFAQFPAHCVRGTSEANAVGAFQALPFYDQMVISEKNSINPFQSTDLNKWLERNPQVDTFVVVGDCTDICVYQLAMHLRTDANARQVRRRVIVPKNCVNTYDISIETAQAVGAIPHPGDLLHAIYLYHMRLNGVEIVAEIF